MILYTRVSGIASCVWSVCLALRFSIAITIFFLVATGACKSQAWSQMDGVVRDHLLSSQALSKNYSFFGLVANVVYPYGALPLAEGFAPR